MESLSLSNNTEAESILDTAIRCGSFRIKLERLNSSILTVLRIMIEDLFLEECKTNLPGFFGGLVVRVRIKIANITGQKYDPLPTRLRTLQNLHDEVTMALGEFTPSEEKNISPERYMDQLLKFIKSHPDFSGNASLSELKIMDYVKCENRQVLPHDDPDYKVVISKKFSYEDNVLFILEHINRSIVMRNQMRDDKMNL